VLEDEVGRIIGTALAGVAFLVAPALLSGDAQAESQRYAWCVFYDPSTYNCGFTTYQQCMETARGSGGICRPNSFEAPRPQQKRQPRPN
jgi:hypothetical protein